MDETKRWAIALAVSVVIALGGNYWMTTLNQATITQQIVGINATLEQHDTDIDELEATDDEHAARINSNVMAINEVNQGWKTVAKAVDANTEVLTRFTELVIRQEERDKLKK